MAIPVLPPSAPFSTEQRAYLNGFFAGVFGFSTNAAQTSSHNSPLPSPTVSPAILDEVPPSQLASSTDETTPWHDPALSLNERTELAKDRPLAQKLMAAMAQLDCGQCGYSCKTYAESIENGSEKSLRKCIPGGKETATKLKELMASPE